MLMLQDVEIQKRILRRYMMRLEKNGELGEPIGWYSMKHAFLMRPAWFFKVPSPEQRPDIHSYPELVVVIDRIRRDWVVIGRILIVFVPAAVITILGVINASQ